MASKKIEGKWGIITSSQLAEIIRRNSDLALVIDSRSFLEYNTSHIIHSVNVCCSKLVKRRLQQDKVTVLDLLAQACEVDTIKDQDIVVYDQCSTTTVGLSPDCFLVVLLNKLVNNFNKVLLLRGGFLEFQTNNTSLCESKTTTTTSSGGYKCPPLTSMSQPCLPVANVGPIKILPFLYLGSQHDALSQDTMQQNGITYILNVSTSCPRPPFITEGHFLRLAVNDNYSDKLAPLFPQAFQFLDKVRESSENVLIHCLAGISRSATVAIAYIMYHLNMSSDEAYKYVKDKRPTISPNFNFLGQLLEYEKQLKKEKGEQENVSPPLSVSATKKQCTESIQSPPAMQMFGVRKKRMFKPFVFSSHTHTATAVQSPTTALSKLSFGAPSPVTEESEQSTPTPTTPKTNIPFPQLPTTSLDLLSFTPCFASDSRETSPANISLSNVVSEARSPSIGTKRPLDFSISSPISNISTQEKSSGVDGIDRCNASEDIKLRSPEIKAKRSLVRPNSISFSSYPTFDKNTRSSDAGKHKKTQLVNQSSQDKCSEMDVTESIQTTTTSTSGKTENKPEQTFYRRTKDNGNNIATVYESVAVTTSNIQYTTAARPHTIMVSSNSSYAVEMRTKEAAERSSDMEQARRSRSLEDILNVDSEEGGAVGGCPSHARKSRRHKRLMEAAEGFSSSAAVESAHRCRLARDSHHHHHQSSSSISSSGSSLHGSLELIQVS